MSTPRHPAEPTRRTPEVTLFMLVTNKDCILANYTIHSYRKLWKIFLDVVAGPLAVMAGVVATAAVITDLPPMVRWSVAIIAGGGVAGVVHSVTSVARLKSSALTAGLGNFVLATLEWVGSLIAALIAIFLPVLAITLVAALLLLFVMWKNRAVARRPT